MHYTRALLSSDNNIISAEEHPRNLQLNYVGCTCNICEETKYLQILLMRYEEHVTLNMISQNSPLKYVLRTQNVPQSQQIFLKVQDPKISFFCQVWFNMTITW